MQKYKYYIIYKITCLLNNKIYIGQHRTNNLIDNYLGSGGKLYQDDLEKFGKENFRKEIILYCKNENELNKKEAEIVNEEFISRNDTYNYQVGGGFDQKKWSEAGCIAFKEKIKNDNEFKKAFSLKMSSINKKTYSQKINFINAGKTSFSNKKHTNESKRKIGEANSKYQKGNLNSQYNTCWIYNEELKENKKIKKNDLRQWLNKGWIKGRKIIL